MSVDFDRQTNISQAYSRNQVVSKSVEIKKRTFKPHLSKTLDQEVFESLVIP